MIEEDYEYEETSWVSFVNVDGTDIRADDVQVTNIEENIYGEDVLTFMHDGKQRRSLVRMKHLPNTMGRSWRVSMPSRHQP